MLAHDQIRIEFLLQWGYKFDILHDVTVLCSVRNLPHFPLMAASSSAAAAQNLNETRMSLTALRSFTSLTVNFSTYVHQQTLGEEDKSRTLLQLKLDVNLTPFYCA